MMNSLPLVTVAVPSYNHERFIEECIDSIIAQTYKNIDLIVVDDGSTDRSPEMLKTLQSKYGFKLFLQTNQGLPKTLNNIIKDYTHGIYFSICASDDYWLPTKIEKQVAFMEANPIYPMCYGKTYYVNTESEILDKYNIVNNSLKGGWLFNDILLFKIHPPVNYLYRTAIFDEVGCYDENILAEDYYMNLKISRKYPIGFLDEYLGFYRMQEKQFKIAGYNKVADSHLMTIEGYRAYPFYKKAKNIVYLRKFNMLSGFAKYKKEALVNLIKSMPFFYKIVFLKAFLKLFISWKRNGVL
jgi:alpha-1,3-rhamnosyltransferase